jgi:hypothetical protein
MLRRVVGVRARDPDTVHDLVQEALARVIAVRGRLDDEAVAPLRHRHRPQPGHPLPGRRTGAGATGPAWAARASPSGRQAHHIEVAYDDITLEP